MSSPALENPAATWPPLAKGKMATGQTLYAKDGFQDRSVTCVRIHALGRLEITKSPITKKSIFVLRKQSRASFGLQTTGSFSLNEVFSTIGMPVSLRNSSIKR